MVKGFQRGQPKGHLQEQTEEKQKEGRPGGGGRGGKQRCTKYIGDITQKILDAAEGCTGGVQNQDRQTGRSGSK